MTITQSSRALVWRSGPLLLVLSLPACDTLPGRRSGAPEVSRLNSSSPPHGMGRVPSWKRRGHRMAIFARIGGRFITIRS